MTSYRNERNRKKLLVPVVALVVCAAAMIGLGYAALESTVTNQANVVAGDGLDAELRGTDGNLLAGAQFSAGADKIDFGTKQTNADKTYYVLAMDEIKLGEAVLRVEALTTAGTANVTQVDVWYEITWSNEPEPAPFGMTSSLEIGGQTITPGVDNGTETPLALLPGATEFAVVLNGAIPEPAESPEIPTYSITFHVVPA